MLFQVLLKLMHHPHIHTRDSLENYITPFTFNIEHARNLKAVYVKDLVIFIFK